MTSVVPFIHEDIIRNLVRDQIAKTYPEGMYHLPLDVEELAEVKLGIPLHLVDLPKSILGYANIQENAIYINAMIEQQHTRFRFTIAHELGHLTLHRELVKRDDPLLTTLNQSLLAPDNESRIEYQANLYAGELLIPTGYLEWLYENHFKDALIQPSSSKRRAKAHEMIRWVVQTCDVSRKCARVRLKHHFALAPFVMDF